MKMTFMLLLIPMIACASFNKAYLTVYVVDPENNTPLGGANVIANFVDDIGWRAWTEPPNPDIAKGVTDFEGLCRLEGRTNCGKSSCWIDKAPTGYYEPAYGENVKYANRSLLGTWQPDDIVVTLAVQRVEHPIPLYVQRAILDGGRNSVGGFDGTNSVLRFDFVVGDWLPPEGKGEYADMTVTTEYKLRDIVKDGKYRIQVFYDFLSRIEFSGPGNGLVEKSTSGQNCGIRIRTASEDGYVPSKAIRFGRRRKITSTVGVYPQYYEDSDSDMNYCFRIRSRYDEAGTLVEAYYGKIYGDFRFKGTDKGGFTGMNFLYYLNPTPNDRNLEWDMKNNLCDKPLRMDYEPIGVRYREP